MVRKIINQQMIDKETLILYLLSRVEPRESTKLKINKLAFFAEFGYKYKTGKILSDAEFAGITHGPVINNYTKILNKLQKTGYIKIEGNYIVLIKSFNTKIPEEVLKVIDPIIDQYGLMSSTILRTLSHKTDSYMITTEGEKKMGRVINKDLASLETFFDGDSEDDLDEKSLPDFDRSKMVPYEFD